MFRIYANQMSDEELIVLKNVWKDIVDNFGATYASCTFESTDCKDCKYKRLCSSLVRTEEYIDKVIKERNLDK